MGEKLKYFSYDQLNQKMKYCNNPAQQFYDKEYNMIGQDVTENEDNNGNGYVMYKIGSNTDDDDVRGTMQIITKNTMKVERRYSNGNVDVSNIIVTDMFDF